MNSFYASVELLSHHNLKNRPVAVVGDPDSRHGIILAKNQIAKNFGVVTAETLGSARLKCPDLITLPPHHSKYREYSRILNSIYLEYTDMVEPFSVDESWLDVTASEMLLGDAKIIADNIRKRVREELGLTLSAGVSFNKCFAKMGSNYKKPDATTVVSRENYKELIWPLPVSELFFVGRSTAKKLNSLGIYTIGEIASADKNLLSKVFGVHGNKIYIYANGLDDEPVKSYTDCDDVKSVGHGMTFRRNLCGTDDINTALIALSDKVSSRLRSYKKWANGVKIEITTPEFKRFSKQKRLTTSISNPTAIKDAGFELIKELKFTNKPIRLLTVTAIDLSDSPNGGQLTIFSMGLETAESTESDKNENLGIAMDKIREKFGSSSIKFAHIIKNDIGIDDNSGEED